MQFAETNTKLTTCPVCGKPVPVRSVRDTRSKQASYCSRVCASQGRYATRYRGSLAGPYDRPSRSEKTKFDQYIPEEQKVEVIKEG